MTCAHTASIYHHAPVHFCIARLPSVISTQEHALNVAMCLYLCCGLQVLTSSYDQKVRSVKQKPWHDNCFYSVRSHGPVRQLYFQRSAVLTHTVTALFSVLGCADTQ